MLRRSPKPPVLGETALPEVSRGTALQNLSTPHPRSPDAAAPPEAFLDRMWRLSCRFPAFVMEGLEPPADAELWSAAELELFVASGAAPSKSAQMT